MNLCALIEACGRAGVSSFEMGEIKIKFGADKPKEIVEVLGTGDNRVEFKEDSATIGDRDEKNIRDLQTDEMLLLDPLNFEKLQMGDEV